MMTLRTMSHGDLTIIFKANLKVPYPKLKRTVSIDNEIADIVAVTSQLTCSQNGKTYKGYHVYILKEVEG